MNSMYRELWEHRREVREGFPAEVAFELRHAQ